MNSVRSMAPDQTPVLSAADQSLVCAAPFGLRREIGSPTFCYPIRHFLTQATDHLPAAPVVKREQQDDEPTGSQAAEIPQAFDQDNLGPVAGCRHRR